MASRLLSMLGEWFLGALLMSELQFCVCQQSLLSKGWPSSVYFVLRGRSPGVECTLTARTCVALLPTCIKGVGCQATVFQAECSDRLSAMLFPLPRCSKIYRMHSIILFPIYSIISNSQCSSSPSCSLLSLSPPPSHQSPQTLQSCSCTTQVPCLHPMSPSQHLLNSPFLLGRPKSLRLSAEGSKTTLALRALGLPSAPLPSESTAWP